MDWIAGILEITGMWIIGNKNRVGFILTTICGLCWIYVAFDKHIYGLLIVVVPALFVNVRNFIKWGKKNDD